MYICPQEPIISQLSGQSGPLRDTMLDITGAKRVFSLITLVWDSFQSICNLHAAYTICGQKFVWISFDVVIPGVLLKIADIKGRDM